MGETGEWPVERSGRLGADGVAVEGETLAGLLVSAEFSRVVVGRFEPEKRGKEPVWEMLSYRNAWKVSGLRVSKTGEKGSPRVLDFFWSLVMFTQNACGKKAQIKMSESRDPEAGPTSVGGCKKKKLKNARHLQRCCIVFMRYGEFKSRCLSMWLAAGFGDTFSGTHSVRGDAD